MERLSCLTAALLVMAAWTADAGRSMLYLAQSGQKLRGGADASALASKRESTLVRTPETTLSAEEVAEFTSVLETLGDDEWASLRSTSGAFHSSEEQPLLPEALRPDAGYFDATRTVWTLDGDSQTVASWSDVFADPDAPIGILWIEGDCQLLVPANGGPTSVWFDGQACSAHSEYGMSQLWDTSASSNVTAIWIGRVSDGKALPYPERASCTPFGFERGLYATAWDVAAAVDGDEDGRYAGSDEGLVPPPPLNRWTMEVAIQSSVSGGADGGDGLTMSYYRYGSGGVGKWRFASAPVEMFPMGELVVGFDARDGLGYFYGELSIVLLYNRGLEERELRQLAAFYAPRFGWEAPQL